MILLFLNFKTLAATLSLYILSMNFTIEISGFDSDKGKAFVEIIDENGIAVSRLVLPILGKKVVKTIELPSSGKYGLKVFHDENNNKKLDKNLVGYPTEKWGVSNGIRPSFRAPKTEEILISLKENDKVKIVVE